MKARDRAEVIKAIRSIFSSLDSHLDYTVEPVKPKKFRAIHGGVRFHKQCVRDYAETLLTLAKLL
jgi:hypothetical protein